MVVASCLCKSIEFTVSGDLHYSRYCHCESCRKYSGTSGAAWSTAETAHFAITKLGAQISRYRSGSTYRCFCSNCGSPLYSESLDYPELIGIPLGVLDDGDIPEPELRLWIRSKKEWESVDDDLPKYDTEP